jgi:predicted aspartyl protease
MKTPRSIKFSLLRAIIFPAVLFSCGICAAQSPGKVLADVPMLFRGPNPAVEVMVNGKGPYLFLLDTGAAGVGRIDSSLEEEIKLPQVGEARGGDGSGQNTRAMPIYRAESLRVGDYVVTGANLASRSYNRPGETPIRGILGFGFFAKAMLVLDFPDKRVRIVEGQLPAADNQEIFAYEMPHGIPKLTMEIQGQTLHADVDTGNQGGLVVPGDVAEKLQFRGEPVRVGTAQTISNTVEIKGAQLRDSFHLGRYEFPQAYLEFDPILSANIGVRVLREFRLTFDPRNMCVRMEREGKQVNLEPRLAPATGATSGAPPAIAPAITISQSDLANYAGVYGERTISAENGSLYIQRPGGTKLKLIPVGPDEFYPEPIPSGRIRFIKNAAGKFDELRVLNPQGVWETSNRQN